MNKNTIRALFGMGSLDGQSLQTSLQNIFIDTIKDSDTALISHNEFVQAAAGTRWLKGNSVLLTDTWFVAESGEDYALTFGNVMDKLAAVLGWNDSRKCQKAAYVADICYFDCPTTTVSTKEFTSAVIDSKLFGGVVPDGYMPPRGTRIPFLAHPIFSSHLPAMVSGKQIKRLFVDFWNFSSFLLKADQMFAKLQSKEASQNQADGLAPEDVRFNTFFRKFLKLCPEVDPFWTTPNGQKWHAESNTLNDDDTLAVITWNTVYQALLCDMPQLMTLSELSNLQNLNADDAIAQELVTIAGAPRSALVGVDAALAQNVAEGVAVAGVLATSAPAVVALANEAKTLGESILGDVESAYASKSSTSTPTLTITTSALSQKTATTTTATTAAVPTTAAAVAKPTGSISTASLVPGASRAKLTERVPPPAVGSPVTSYAKVYTRSRPQKLMDRFKPAE